MEEPEADQLRRTIDRMRNMIVMQRSAANGFGNGDFNGQKNNQFNQTAPSGGFHNRIDDFASIELENE